MKLAASTCLRLSVIAAWLASGCSSTPPSPPADLVSPTGVALAGRTVMVASTESDELRVLDISSAPTIQFFEAPNPLFPLSVPVGPRPSALAADAWVNASGGPSLASSPYVFALSVEDRSIAVVTAAPQQLVNVGTLRVPGVPLAIATRAWSAAAGERVVLYVASQEGQSGVVREFLVPATPPFDPNAACSATDPTTVCSYVVATLPGSYPQTIDVIRTDKFDRVAVGLRQPADGVSGAVVLTIHSEGPPPGNVTVAPIVTGGPVRKVAFTPVGTPLYMMMDADGCPAPHCHTLVFSNLTTASDVPSAISPSVEIPGSPLNMSVGTNVCVALNLTSVPTNLQCSPAVTANNLAQQFGVFILVGSSDGNLYAVNGDTFQLINADTVLSSNETVLATPSVLTTPVLVPAPENQTLCLNEAVNCANANGDKNSPDCIVVNGPRCTDSNGPLPTSIGLSQGVSRTEHIFVVYEGPIAPFASRPAKFQPGSPTSTIADPGMDFAALGVQDQDIVTVENETCKTEGAVVSRAVGSLGVAGLNPSCVPAALTYSIRPNGAYAVTGISADPPFVVSPSGYLGRALPNQWFPLPDETVRPAAFAGIGFATPIVVAAGNLVRGAGNTVTATLSSSLMPFVADQGVMLTTGEPNYPAGGKFITSVTPATATTPAQFTYVEIGETTSPSTSDETFVAVPVVFLMGSGPPAGPERGEGYEFQVDGAFTPYSLPINSVPGGITFDPVTSTFFLSLSATNYACQITPVAIGVSGGTLSTGEACLQ